MYTVRVLPLAKNIPSEELTYFSKVAIPEGTLVTIPLRNKERSALVLSSREVSAEKSSLKEASYALKKIKSIKTGQLFSKEFLKAAERMARFSASTLGAVLVQSTPASILQSPPVVKKKVEDGETEEVGAGEKPAAEFLVLQAPTAERLSHYKSIVRESFARQKSILLIAPTLEQLEQLQSALLRGIEPYTILLHSDLGVSAIGKLWRKVLTEKHPLLVLTTPLFLSLPRLDWGTIILEGENGIGWKQQRRPFIDMRLLAEYLAEAMRARLIFGDTALRVETLYQYFEGRFSDLSPITNRLPGVDAVQLISMKKEVPEKPGNFPLLSGEAKRLLAETIERGERMFMFTARRGLSPLTVCSDCGSPVLCSRCKAPTILHTKKEGGDEVQFFLCHKCGEVDPPEETCRVCGSWRLFLLGVGIERLERYLAKEFPTLPVFRLDSDSVKNHRKAVDTRNQFFESKGGVLLGTEMALRYLHEPVERTLVVSLDSLSAIPDWRGNEKIFTLVSRMRSGTTKELLIQTRREEELLSQALHGNAVEFYREEIKLRRQFHYPPFEVLIKLSFTGTEKVVLAEEEKLMAYLKEFEPLMYTPAYSEPGKHTRHFLLRIPKAEWPHEGVRQKLLNLPPYVSINVDPESLL